MTRPAEPLWRAITVYRFASLAYAALLIVINRHHYSRLDLAWLTLAAMAVWTIGTTLAYRKRQTATLLIVDFAVTAGLLFATAALQYPAAVRGGTMPVTATWVAGPVLTTAVRYGRRAGCGAALVMSGCDLALRGANVTVVLNGAVLLLLAGVLVGHLAQLTKEIERERHRVVDAIQAAAASQERERLARHIHDSVLQVLTLVQKRGAEAGGEAAELGRLAGQQEAALRTLIGATPAERGDTQVDIRALLAPFEAARVIVSVPATVVMMQRKAGEELTSAVRAALDNVRRHCGGQAKAWLLVEDEPDFVTVTIRDDGPGIAPGRLAEAAVAGRLGVSHSIHGRLRDLGGSAVIRTSPDEGTEIELRVPRSSLRSGG